MIKPAKTILSYTALCFSFALMLCTCSKENSALTYQGYIEGRYSYISPNVSGILQKLYVRRGNTVKKGDRLFLLEEQPESDQLNQTKAKLEKAKAERQQTVSEKERATLDYQRQSSLVRTHATSRQLYDNARIDLDRLTAKLSAEDANIASLTAELAQANWNYEKKAVVASKNAFVFDTYHLPGEYISASKPVLSLITIDDVRVVFFVSQADLTSIQVGKKIQFQCDNCKPAIAMIDYISPKAEYTPPVIYSEKERTKLVYRVEAYPDKNDIIHIHVGQPVEITIPKLP